jgi:gluconate 2-dehydrogenase gamma chain
LPKGTSQQRPQGAERRSTDRSGSSSPSPYRRRIPLVTRRAFLRGAGATAAGAGAAAVLASCAPAEGPSRTAPYAGVPEPALATPPQGVFRFFDAEEARTIEAMLDRLIPASNGVPGARDAGAITYIDNRLANDQGTPTYTDPPFAKTYTGNTPPGPNTDQVIWVRADELTRYGVQDVDQPSQEVYRKGIGSLNAYAHDRFGKDFADLKGDQQDLVIQNVAHDKAKHFSNPLGSTFFNVVNEDAWEGYLCDPMYGGNRNMVVWKALNYPGAQRAYTPIEMKQGTTRGPQSLREMSPMEPGIPGGNAVLPISGHVGSSDPTGGVFACNHEVD